MNKLGLLIFIFLLISCKKEEINQDILGTWEWQETIWHFRGGTPFTTTPNSLNTAMIVNINSQTVEIFKNSIFFGAFNYTKVTVVGENDIILIDYKNKDLGLKVEQGPISFENDKLIIAGGYNDAGGHQIFVRKK
jgi:hypothetical protein